MEMGMGIQIIKISFMHSPVGTGNHSAFGSGGITKHAARALRLAVNWKEFICFEAAVSACAMRTMRPGKNSEKKPSIWITGQST